jgi:hypothetical protein
MPQENLPRRGMRINVLKLDTAVQFIERSVRGFFNTASGPVFEVTANYNDITLPQVPL